MSAKKIKDQHLNTKKPGSEQEEKTKVAATLYYQHAEFDSDYAFPYRRKTGASFDNLTYNVVSNISVSRNNNLKFTAV